jgi:hypothetical protein
MYLGRLRSLLPSAQVSQYIPNTRQDTLFFTKNNLVLPSAPKGALRGTCSAYTTNIIGPTPYTQTTDKVNFVTFVVSALSTSLWAQSLTQAGGVSNSGTAGYRHGGSNGTSEQNTIAKFTFSSQTAANLGATLPGTHRTNGSINNNGTAGYTAGGALGTQGTAIYKILYSNDTSSSISATLSSSRYANTGISNSGTAGYWVGGEV